MNAAGVIGRLCRRVQGNLSAVRLAAYDFCCAGACCVCGNPIADESPRDAGEAAPASSGMLCADCIKALARLENYPACHKCAAALPYAGAPCADCRGKGRRLLKRVAALGPFADPLRQLIHHFKYHQHWALGEELTDRLRSGPRAAGLLSRCDVIVPVPLHHWRQMRRGYNQADVISRRLGQCCGVSVVQAVRRVRHTQTQTHLHSRRQREENLRDAFGIRSASDVAGKHVLLIDDVMTTGATLHAVARVLKTARPASISALVLAVADAKYQTKPRTSQIPQIA